MDEKYLEQAQLLEEQVRQAGLDKIPKYRGNYTHCRIPGCGAELPEVRRSIGLCIECAEDEEKLAAKRKREYSDHAHAEFTDPGALFHGHSRKYESQEYEDE